MNNISSDKSAIFALSSGQGKAGIAVFRISGDYDSILNVLRAMTRLDINKVISKPRYAFFTSLFHSVTHEKIDDALILFFPSPYSFTGDNVLELQTHGGIATVQVILNSLSNIPNLRLAEKGEFTKRAFFNGKIDLLQVEGLSDLIDAETEQSRKQALTQLNGSFSSKLLKIKDQLVYILSLATAQIDFLADEINSKYSNDVQGQIINSAKELLQDLEKILNNNIGEIIRSGVFVAIIGAPNVGKSSLFNALIGHEKSIISSIPGTTRDIVDVRIDIDGIAVELADTAGLRETADIIESEGIKRALNYAEKSDLKILVLDGGILPNQIKPDNNTIIVINKIDLIQNLDKSKYPIDSIFISAKTGDGLEDLKEHLSKKIQDKFNHQNGEVFITQERHRQAIKNMVHFLKELLNLSKMDGTLDLQAENIKLALNEIEYLTGKLYFNELLDNIFSNFCIGK